MQYLTGYYWQEGEHNATSLVLQQVCLKKTNTPIVLACVCTDMTEEGKGRSFAEGVTDWFYETGLSLCDRGWGRVGKRMSDSLEEYLRQREKQEKLWMEKPQNGLRYGVAGTLCVGDSLWMFQQGSPEICVLNTRNLRPCCQNMRREERESGMSFRGGVIERGVGILLVTEGMYRQIPSDLFAECLDMGRFCSQNRLDKRLQELGCKGERLGGVDMGAILLTAR